MNMLKWFDVDKDEMPEIDEYVLWQTFDSKHFVEKLNKVDLTQVVLWARFNPGISKSIFIGGPLDKQQEYVNFSDDKFVYRDIKTNKKSVYYPVTYAGTKVFISDKMCPLNLSLYLLKKYLESK